MGSDKKHGTDPAKMAGKAQAGQPAESAPAWADGLKNLYDSVVEEPLPDSFLELLGQFEDDDADPDADPDAEDAVDDGSNGGGTSNSGSDAPENRA